MSLKEKDKVYTIAYQRWFNKKTYILSTVEKLTKTQAVLSNGDRLINEKTTDWVNKECYSEYGNRGNKWYILTDEVLLEVEKIRENNKIKKWFDERNFDDSERKLIYLYFKDLGILEKINNNEQIQS